MYRLFAAIDFPSDVKSKLIEIGGGIPGARWLQPDQLHLTLRFIGEVDGGVFRDVIDALGEIASEPFELELKGVGHFPPRKTPEVLWVGVTRSESLTLLHNRIESALARIGIDRESRKFAPHVAIARLRDPNVERVARFLAMNGLFSLSPFTITEFVLYSSVLSSEGAQYQVEALYPLHRDNHKDVSP